MEKAPIHIIICSEPEKYKRFYGVRGERLYNIQGCAAAVENILLSAHSLGLGACWVGAFDDDAIRRILTVPEHVMLHAIITIGYADEIPEMPQKYRIEHIVFLESWGQRKKIPLASLGWLSSKTEKTVKDTKRNIRKMHRKINKKIRSKQ